MPTTQLRALRQRYREAYTAYMGCVQQLAEMSKVQQPPAPTRELLDSEARAFHELASARNELLSALSAHYLGQ